MAVTNLHYITRMSSGFKVYILEGQPNLRTEDRYRHMANDKARISPVYPIKRKHSPERGLTAGERSAKVRRLPHVLTSRQRVFRNTSRSVQRTSSLSPPHCPASSPQNSAVTTTSWSPHRSPSRSFSSSTPSPISPLSSPVFAGPPLDEPLALIKKPRWGTDGRGEKASNTTCSRIQIRPSVITCVSSVTCSTPLSPDQCCKHSASAMSQPAYDHVVEEHFRRSLGVNYPEASKAKSCQLSVAVSVDDHFAKALGEKWFQLKSSPSFCSSSSSSPTSNRSFCLSPSRAQSPEDSGSPSTPHPTSPWPDSAQDVTKK
ncbi:hypothetical protein MATL_G00110250 [Megalops atlanticus]|uniref:Transcription cofactor vestigial-like protein 4 n=1 Tax=Megalops atlanticus TaxID=7932 RepID=A0A9D3Q4R6_MEGAT|nr:hypothetical protein MATL_G00110250 [Megalops atlanticus]